MSLVPFYPLGGVLPNWQAPPAERPILLPRDPLPIWLARFHAAHGWENPSFLKARPLSAYAFAPMDGDDSIKGLWNEILAGQAEQPPPARDGHFFPPCAQPLLHLALFNHREGAAYRPLLERIVPPWSLLRRSPSFVSSYALDEATIPALRQLKKVLLLATLERVRTLDGSDRFHDELAPDNRLVIGRKDKLRIRCAYNDMASDLYARYPLLMPPPSEMEFACATGPRGDRYKECDEILNEITGWRWQVGTQGDLPSREQCGLALPLFAMVEGLEAAVWSLHGPNAPLACENPATVYALDLRDGHYDTLLLILLLERPAVQQESLEETAAWVNRQLRGLKCLYFDLYACSARQIGIKAARIRFHLQTAVQEGGAPSACFSEGEGLCSIMRL